MKTISEIGYVMRAVSKDDDRLVMMSPLIARYAMVGVDGYRMHWVGDINAITAADRETYNGLFLDIRQIIPTKGPVAFFDFGSFFEEIYKEYKSLLREQDNCLILKMHQDRIEAHLGGLLVRTLKEKVSGVKEEPIEIKLNARFLSEATKNAGRSFTFKYYGSSVPVVIQGIYNALILPKYQIREG